MDKTDKKYGLVIVNTGDGKGQTTASLGIAFRALGWRKKVLIVQFLKGNLTQGEEKTIQKYSLPIEYKPFGSVSTPKEKGRRSIREKCQNTWEFLEENILKADYDLIIADEINIAMSFGLINSKDVINALQKRKSSLHVVLTGRNAPEEIKEYADLVSVIDEYKHPFYQGIPAQKGMEF